MLSNRMKKEIRKGKALVEKKGKNYLIKVSECYSCGVKRTKRENLREE